jgi:hypothetical protein
MRLELPTTGLALDVGADWMLMEPYDQPSVQEVHGVYLRSVQHGIQIHVRPFSAPGYELTTSGLLRLLHEQNWASQPRDETTTVAGEQVTVAGTFEMVGGRGFVREFFFTDGRSLANAAMPGTLPQINAARTAAERLMASIHFASTPPA